MNFLIFLTDQQRADCVPGEAPDGIELPNMSWLADRGTTFDRAYCPSPISAPARAALLTGLFPSQTGLEANYSHEHAPSPPAGMRTIGHMLGEAGYDSAYCGKWHLPTGSARPGFSEVLGRAGLHDLDCAEEDDAVRQAKAWGVALGENYASFLARRDASTASRFHGRATKLPLSAHPSTQMALRSASWLRSAARREKPFLLVHSMIEPHPLGSVFRIAPAPFDRMYDPARFDLPPTLREKGVGKLLQGAYNYSGLFPTDGLSDDEIRDRIAGYMGAVSYVDFLFGILLEGLAANGLLDDTLIIFTSDHGEMLGHHRMLKKGPLMYEDLVRVPLIAANPGAGSSARTCHSLVSLIDIAPTLCHLAAGAAPPHLPGRVFLDASGRPVGAADNPVVVEYHSAHWGEPAAPLRALITRDWKLILKPGGTAALYDLKKDPHETVNVVGRHPEVESRLVREYFKRAKEIGDPWPEVRIPDCQIPQRTGKWENPAFL